MKKDFNVYALRRKDLVNRIKEHHSSNHGTVMILSGFETERSVFWQESSFFYYTGVTEPSTVLTIDLDGKSALYEPNFGGARKQWVYSPIELTQENAKILGVDTVAVLGEKCAGYMLFPFFKKEAYSTIIAKLTQLVKEDSALFTLYPDNEHGYLEQRLVIDRLKTMVPGLAEIIVDVSDIVADMRRSKDMDEIEQITKAVEITCLAHEAAAQALDPGMFEREVQASLEYMMVGSGARPSFPSIVAAGKNGTILHYNQNHDVIKKDDLVVVDIGAMYDGYCADLTRTYPASGKFSKRQKELYDIVLATQEYIADIAKPGMYLNNAEFPEQSLNHLARVFLKKHKLDQYFVHGIGHYLGLDVHDVGSYKTPLRENDVITIEPGLYIPEEGIGIRIEDNYWIVKKGAICLSENLPKRAEDIEELVQRELEDQFEDEDEPDEGMFHDDEDEDMEH